MTNSLPWFVDGPVRNRWFTELNSMVDLSMAMLVHNQRVREIHPLWEPCPHLNMQVWIWQSFWGSACLGLEAIRSPSNSIMIASPAHPGNQTYMGIEDHNLYRIWGVNLQLHCQLFGRSPAYQGFDMFGHLSIRSFKSYVTLWCQSEASPDDHHIPSTLLRTLWKLISSSGWSVCKMTLAPLGPHTLEIHAWRKVHQQPISKLYNVVGKPHQSYWIYLNLNLQMNLAKNGAPDCRWFVAFLIGSVYFHHNKIGLIIPEYWPHSLIICDIKVVGCHQTFPNMFWSQELASWRICKL